MRRPDERPGAREKSGARGGAPRPYRRPGGGGRKGAEAGDGALWLFGFHAVRAAIDNPRRRKHRLLATPNALIKLGDEVVARAGLTPEVQDPRRFSAPLDPASVHQGVALECDPLEWGSIAEVCALRDRKDAPRALLLDQVTDPHNVGAILRSAEVFGARAVIAPRRKAAPETGALAKSASGALERMPYLRVGGLSKAINELQEIGYTVIGLDGEANLDLRAAADATRAAPAAIALGAEGAGLRSGTRDACDALAKITAAADFASLNVSNAAAVALFALTAQ